MFDDAPLLCFRCQAACCGRDSYQLLSTMFFFFSFMIVVFLMLSPAFLLLLLIDAPEG
jgi:hypothetical protein